MFSREAFVLSWNTIIGNYGSATNITACYKDLLGRRQRQELVFLGKRNYLAVRSTTGAAAD